MEAPLLTGDELTAIARGFGAPRFPGVGPTLYDGAAPELHPLIDERLLASLVARGALAPDGDGELLPVAPFDAVLAAVLTHRTYVAVEQLAPPVEPGEFVTRAFLAGDHGVVRHTAAEPFHSLERESDDLAEALTTLVAPPAVPESPVSGAAAAGTARRRYRGRRSGLAELIPPPERGWRRATVLTRTDNAGDRVRVEAFLAVFDAGSDGLWLVGEDEYAEPAPDRPLLAERVAADGVPTAIKAFAELTGSAAATVAGSEKAGAPWRS